MKKSRLFVCVLLVLVSCFSVACGKQNGGKKETPSDGKVTMDKTLFNEYAHENVFEIKNTAEGLEMQGIQNLKCACSKMRFSIEEGQKLSLTFKAPVWENDSEDYLVDGVNMYTKTCVDVMLRGQTASAPIAQLRLWGEKAVDKTSVSGRVAYGMDGSSYAYESSFGSTGLPFSDTKKVSGNMRENSYFTIEFDKENLFSSYVGGERMQIEPLLDESNEEAKQTANGIREAFKDVKSVSIVLRFSGKLREDLVEMGYTGFEASSRIIISEINGQSLATADGRLKDTKKPYISAPEIVEGLKLSAYNRYTYEVKSNESVTAGNSTVLYSAFATDVLSWAKLSYALLITPPNGTETRTEGLDFSTQGAGVYKVRVAVKDESGNEYISPQREFVVVDTYRINLDGEIPAKAKKNAELTLPNAYVTNASGERTDANGQEYPLEVSVSDPLDLEVEIVNGKIKFTRTGTYIIRYTSTSEDGSDEKEFRIIVS
ncbi:MAG: hypothetical protein IJY62_06830 [Clostridia bacterium]|nr:hypothetical protein [Clostridia bacterium]